MNTISALRIIFGHCRILCRLAIGNNQRRHGIRFAQSIDVRVVIVVATRAQNQKISAITLVAQPAERLVQIVPTAHHGDARDRFGLNIFFISQSEIFIGFRVPKTHHARHKN